MKNMMNNLKVDQAQKVTQNQDLNLDHSQMVMKTIIQTMNMTKPTKKEKIGNKNKKTLQQDMIKQEILKATSEVIQDLMNQHSNKITSNLNSQLVKMNKSKKKLEINTEEEETEEEEEAEVVEVEEEASIEEIETTEEEEEVEVDVEDEEVLIEEASTEETEMIEEAVEEEVETEVEEVVVLEIEITTLEITTLEITTLETEKIILDSGEAEASMIKIIKTLLNLEHLNLQ